MWMCIIFNIIIILYWYTLSNIDNVKKKQTTFNTKLWCLFKKKNANIRVTLQAALLLAQHLQYE